jgi:hypothetical protein
MHPFLWQNLDLFLLQMRVSDLTRLCHELVSHILINFFLSIIISSLKQQINCSGREIKSFIRNSILIVLTVYKTLYNQTSQNHSFLSVTEVVSFKVYFQWNKERIKTKANQI